jgi:hypothetical protein
VILRCLEEDARNRPPSVLAVARLLPGGDALAAALAAGEMPSPKVVAAAGDIGGISVRSAAMYLASILVGLIAAAALAGKANVIEKTPFENSPEVHSRPGRRALHAGRAAVAQATVLGWFKRQGTGYQTRMNQVLRRYMDVAWQQRVRPADQTRCKTSASQKRTSKRVR